LTAWREGESLFVVDIVALLLCPGDERAIFRIILQKRSKGL